MSAQGMRQIDVAEPFNLDPHMIGGWENGKKSIGHPRYYPRIIAGSDMIPFPSLDPTAKHGGKNVGDSD